MTESLKKYITRNKIKSLLYLLTIISFIVFLGFNVDFSIVRLFKGSSSMYDLLERMLHPNPAYIGEVLEKILETIEIAIISSIIGVFLAIPFSLLTSNNIAPSKFFAIILNNVFAFFRTIPNLIWAALLVSIFSIGKFSGIIALTITAFLMSLKLLRENIESISENLLNSTRSVGGSGIQVLRYTVLPSILELSIAIFFMVLEVNIRSATILGLVGAGGIGQIMWRDLNHLRYDNLSTLILILLFTIILIDLLSLFIRNWLKKSNINFKSIESYKNFKKMKLFILPIAIIFLVILVTPSLNITYDRFVLGLEQGSNMIARMVRIDTAYIPRLLEGIWESLFIALFATTIGSIFAFILSYFTSYNTSPKKLISLTFKGFINLLRTFPPIITAIIFFRGLGPGPLSGAMALSIYTTGVLTKQYSEVLESSHKNITDAIIATGGTNLNSYTRGLIPYTLPTYISLVLYRLESNIRTSTILGIIGAGGVGTILTMNINWRNWERVGLLLLGISIMIISIDIFSHYIRKNFN